MNTTTPYRFDPIDPIEMRRWAQLTPGQRLRVMLNAKRLAMGLLRGSLTKLYPTLSRQEINLKLLEELDRRAKQPPPKF